LNDTKLAATKFEGLIF